ncbi:MAG: hypothetical protein A3H91_08465 [Gammaproteobacteria bacterium RIFCSPLOWO2_02_FULL_61_13]|nr:MAG: hypothetical protein A3H91_08465 [Gammaproteobacteria bacterium RIFCSPLOWO2_02_FULL_61_13]
MIRKLLYLNFRAMYRLSQWLRQRFTPTGLALFSTAVAAGIFGVNTRQTLAYQIFAFLVAILVVSALASFRFRPVLRVRRLLPRFGTVGLPLAYAIELENSGKRGERDLCVLDELEAPFPTLAEFRNDRDPEDARRNWFDRKVGYPRLMGQVQLRRGASLTPAEAPLILPGEPARLDLEFMPLRRGYLRFRRVVLCRPDPFGLFRALRGIPAPETLLILPRVYRAPEIRLPGQRRFQPGGMTLASTVGDSQEFLSLRDYKPGDPLRAIHWRSFAKLGRPVVKEFQDEFFVRQGLVLDTYLDAQSPAEFEAAVSVAASLAMRTPGRDALLDLMFVGTQAYRVTIGRGLGQVENMLEILACVEPHRTGTFRQLTDLVARHGNETSALICVLLAWDGQRQELVSRMLRAGIPVLALVIGADAAELAADPGPLAAMPERLVALPLDAIQATLDNLGTMRHAA